MITEGMRMQQQHAADSLTLSSSSNPMMTNATTTSKMWSHEQRRCVCFQPRKSVNAEKKTQISKYIISTH